MGTNMISADSISWQTVDNTVHMRMVDGSLVHTVKVAKRIKRRTRALNSALKKFASLKSYSQYVKAKTTILRDITDNEETDEEPDYCVGLEVRNNGSLTPPPSLIKDLAKSYSNHRHRRDTAKSSRKEKRTRRKTNDAQLDSAKSSKKGKLSKRKTNDIKSDSAELSRKEEKSISNKDEMESDAVKSPKLKKRTTKKTNDIEADPPESPKNEKGAATKTDELDSDLVKSCEKKIKTRKVTDKIDSDSAKSPEKERVTTQKPNKIESNHAQCPEKTRASRKSGNNESDSSKPTAVKNTNQNEEYCAKVKTSKRDTRLLCAKRNLTSALDNFNDANCISRSEAINPITENSMSLVCPSWRLSPKSTESSKSNNDESDVDSVYQKSAFIANEISVDVHAENDDEGILKKENEENGYEDNEENGNGGNEEIGDESNEKIAENGVEVKKDENGYEDESDTDQLQFQEEEEMMDESLSKKSQPVITCTEILKSKYTIVRDESEGDVIKSPNHEESELPLETTSLRSEEAITEDNEPSPESKRVGQMKRINLTANSSDSEDSELGEQEDEKIVAPARKTLSDVKKSPTKSPKKSPTKSPKKSPQKSPKEKSFLQKVPLPLLQSSSQAITDPSASDESAAEADEMNIEEVFSGQPNDDKSSLQTLSDSKASVSSRIDKEHRTPDKKSLKNTIKGESEGDPVEHLDPEKSELFPEATLPMDEDATEHTEVTPERKRVGQLKRMNLITDGSDSEESELSEQEDEKIVDPAEKSRVGQLKRMNLTTDSSDKRSLKNTIKDESEGDPVEHLDPERFELFPEATLPMDEEATEHTEVTPERKRVGQLKRMNLITDGSDSEESELSEQEDEKIVGPTEKSRVGQLKRMNLTADSSDSEELELSEQEDGTIVGPAETTRVGQLKRMNLTTDSSDSEEHEHSEQEDEKIVAPAEKSRSDFSEKSQEEKSFLQKVPPPLPSSSQVISDPSDSEASAAEADDEGNNEQVFTRMENAFSSPDKRPLGNVAKGSASKSIRSQIREQENEDTSPVLEKIEAVRGKEKSPKKRRHSETSVKNHSTSNDKDIVEEDDGNSRATNKVVNRITNDVPCESDSLRYVLKNLARRDDDDSEREMENFAASCNAATEKRKEEEQELDDFPRSRPVELCDFVERERLVATEEASTITAKDLKECTREDGDEEIWLMEIPAFLIPKGEEFCGKEMAFEKGKITINGTTYRSTFKEEKSVSCILRSGKKKSRFKTVHLKTAGCIVVRQESSNKTASPSKARLSPLQTQTPVQRSAVPFPKNLKFRNPLLGLDPLSTPQSPSKVKDAHGSSAAKKSQKRKRNIDDSNANHKTVKKPKKNHWPKTNRTSILDNFAKGKYARKKKLDETLET